jgi:predicted GNAT family acetyltransferase
MAPDPLLRRLDAYLDAAPRPATRPEQIGPFTLFVNEGKGWRYYARPTPGEEAFTVDDVRAVLERQRARQQPREFEWIVEVTPSLSQVARDGGLRVVERPLMHLAWDDLRGESRPEDAVVRVVTLDDDLATVSAVAAVGFATPGTEAAAAGIDALAGAVAKVDEDRLEFLRERMTAGLTVTAAAFVDGVPVAVGSHQPMEGATEIVGVATLPSFRRRGLGSAVTETLARDAYERGVDTVLLSAGDEAVARIYGRVGFRTVGRVGAADSTS